MQGIDAGVVEAIVAPAVPGQPVRLVFRVDQRLRRLVRSDAHELRGASRLLFTVLSSRLLLRYVLLGTGLSLLPFARTHWASVPIALAMIAGEFVSRYLFFVSVVPTNMATEYLSAEAA